MNPIQLAAILQGFATKVDGSASLRFTTNELTDNDVLELKRRQGQFGWLLFAPNPFTEASLPTEMAEDTQKTPSRRLRAVLFVLWRQQGSKGDFEIFYRERMDKLIEAVKAKLD